MATDEEERIAKGVTCRLLGHIMHDYGTRIAIYGFPWNTLCLTCYDEPPWDTKHEARIKAAQR